MRRSDREVTDRAEIARIIASCDCCRVGFAAEDGVYIVPLNFAYVETGALGALYFHGAKEGRKAGLIAARPKVGFEMDCAHRLVPNDSLSCKFTMMYKSVIGVGRPRELAEAERADAFRILMAHYCDQELPFNPEILKRTLLFAVDVDEITCKVHL